MRLWVGLWFVLITALSLAPLSAKRLLHTRGPWHDRGHLVVFFVTGIVALGGAQNVSCRWARALLTTAFCVALESLQMVGTHHRFEWSDFWTDTLGIFLAWFTVIVVQIILSTANPKKQSRQPVIE